MYSLADKNLVIKDLGIIDYAISNQDMHSFTETRNDETQDEIWFVEHHSIFTQGRAGKPEHILKDSHIPIFYSDRGGQVTYHGPGQIILYPLINLKKRGLNIREFVSILENTVINSLSDLNIEAYARKDAPGVYVKLPASRVNSISKEAKICSLGLKVSKGCTLHGLALNYDNDLTPFEYINPCGLMGMEMTSLEKLVPTLPSKARIKSMLINSLAGYL